ncbi:hypothetical protein AMECASPLE_038859 [Ameca splendens]|uniref:Uncharacterized protein n=1 Tax=Ameca splendens TaxID=208324 RepID=A0ABV0XLD8_9TELE
MHVTTVERKNSLLTGRNFQQNRNQARCERPCATTDWGFETKTERKILGFFFAKDNTARLGNTSDSARKQFLVNLWSRALTSAQLQDFLTFSRFAVFLRIQKLSQNCPQVATFPYKPYQFKELKA